MGNVIQAEQAVGRVQIKELRTHTKLQDEKSPVLSCDLDAKGNSIKNLNNVEAKTFNGTTLTALVKGFIDKIPKGDFARKKHDHSPKDVVGLDELVQKKIDAIKIPEIPPIPQSINDLKGEIALSKLNRGKEIDVLLSRALSPIDHKHGNYEEKISTLEKEVQELRDHLFKRAEKSEILRMISDLKAENKKLSDKIESLKNKKPEAVELVFVGHAIIPNKCHGRKITGIVTKDHEGQSMESIVLINSKKSGVGDDVSKDDIVEVSPKCLARLVLE